jgi:hypothetical protein
MEALKYGHPNGLCLVSLDRVRVVGTMFLSVGDTHGHNVTAVESGGERTHN